MCSQGRACTPRCIQPGCVSIPYSTKLRLFNEFYSKTYNQQTAELISLIEVVDFKERRRGNTDATSRKQASGRYTIDGIPVCRSTFREVFQVTNRRCETILKKIKMGVETLDDGRGKFSNLPASVRKFVDKQVDTFVRLHCSNDDTYVGELNQTILLELYKELHPKSKVTETLVGRVFTEVMNDRFSVGENDSCSSCQRVVVVLTLDQKTGKIIQTTEGHCAASAAIGGVVRSELKRSRVQTLSLELNPDRLSPLPCNLFFTTLPMADNRFIEPPLIDPKALGAALYVSENN